ncbi:hypothetical protein KIN20_003940, partial [Parelaphostrongylus tenuis]
NSMRNKNKRSKETSGGTDEGSAIISCAQVLDRRNESIAAVELPKTRRERPTLLKLAGFKAANFYRVVKCFKEIAEIEDCPRNGRSTTLSTPKNNQKISCQINEIQRA